MKEKVHSLCEHVSVARFDYQIFIKFKRKMFPEWIFECGVCIFLAGESARSSIGGVDGGL